MMMPDQKWSPQAMIEAYCRISGHVAQQTKDLAGREAQQAITEGTPGEVLFFAVVDGFAEAMAEAVLATVVFRGGLEFSDAEQRQRMQRIYVRLCEVVRELVTTEIGQASAPECPTWFGTGEGRA